MKRFDRDLVLLRDLVGRGTSGSLQQRFDLLGLAKRENRRLSHLVKYKMFGIRKHQPFVRPRRLHADHGNQL
jgi:hypothetical protein